MFDDAVIAAALLATALLPAGIAAAPPPPPAKGDFLGTYPVDLAGAVQVPAADRGVVVTYHADGSVYAYQPGAGAAARDLMPRGCWGVQVGACCIGIYCPDAAASGQASKRGGASSSSSSSGGGARYDTLRVSADGASKVTALTVYPDRSMNLSVSKMDDLGNDVEYSCIGVHVNGCCVGVCIK